MTLGAEADNEIVRRRAALVGDSIALPSPFEFKDEEDDMAEAALASG